MNNQKVKLLKKYSTVSGLKYKDLKEKWQSSTDKEKGERTKMMKLIIKNH